MECVVPSDLDNLNLEHDDFCRKWLLSETRVSLPVMYFPCIIFVGKQKTTTNTLYLFCSRNAHYLDEAFGP